MRMSSDIAIFVDNISKCYLIYDRPQDRLKQGFFRNRKFYREFWALKDVSLQVKKGETVGIIGLNGSGKSTLLQIIAGILTPTTGNINVYGRVAALLELGSGFNPEFTGRENVIMNGSIMGLSLNEITERIPIIERFAEIGDFFEQPVKTYSSGMFVRLAFACAINVDPDILLIDEALAVGDMQFQLKCMDKLKSLKKSNKTIIFVSHDVYAVRNFCEQSVWMMDGMIHQRGNVHSVTERYYDFMKIGLDKEPPNIPTETKKNILAIGETFFCDRKGKKKKDFVFGEPITIIINYVLNKDMEGLVGGVALFDKQNTYVCGLNTKLDSYLLPTNAGKYQLILKYTEINLMPGTYFIDIGFFEDSAVVQLDYKSRINYFRISSCKYFAEGLSYLNHEWICKM